MLFDHSIVDKILKAIFPLPERFGVIQFDDSFCDEGDFINQKEIYQSLQEVSPETQIYFGITKMVIISPELPKVVIKIPFNGYYLINGQEYDEEGGDLLDHGDWLEFYRSPGSNISDYCLAEYEKYQQLKEQDLDCFVAKTLFYDTIDGVNVFIQEWVTPEKLSENIYKPSLKSKEKVTRLRDSYKELRLPDSNWMGICLDVYGEDKVKSFLSYCKKDPDILYDCHKANYGYRLNDSPAILDFSNFLE